MSSKPAGAATLSQRRQAQRNRLEAQKQPQIEETNPTHIENDDQLYRVEEDNEASSPRISSSSKNSTTSEPPKPRILTEKEINEKIRAELGYDMLDLFREDEGDEDGLARQCGLKNQFEIQDELDKRKAEAKTKKGILEFQMK